MFEGEPDGVEAMLAFCRQGPPGARVDRVEVEDQKSHALEGFEVR